MGQRLEDDLRQQAKRLRMALGAARSGVWNWNVNTGELYWSEEVYDLFGFDASTIPSMDAWLSVVKPEHRAQAEKDIERARQQGSQYRSEFPIVRCGEIRWIQAIGDFVYDSEGPPVQVAGIGIDITDRKRTEEALRESEERFRMATRAAREAIWELDVASGAVSWSETFTRFYGRTEDGGSSIDWWTSRLHPEDRDRVAASLHNALRGAGESWECEYRFRKPDDTWANIYDRALIARSREGKATRLVGAMLDTTELNATRQQLKILRGLLPICASCKKIRDTEGRWHVMEAYIRSHSEAKFSHGLCPECAKEWK